MINISLFSLFILTSVIGVATPGAGIVMLVGISLRHGWRRCVVPALAITLSAMLLFIVSLSGIGVIIASSPVLFSEIKLAGALYLLYLAWASWNAPVKSTTLQEREASQGNPESYLVQSILITLTNPQPIVFGISVFPQFIDLELPYLTQVTIMIVVHAIIAFLCLMVYALLASRARVFIQNENGLRILNRVIAILFSTLAIFLLWMAICP